MAKAKKKRRKNLIMAVTVVVKDGYDVVALHTPFPNPDPKKTTKNLVLSFCTPEGAGEKFVGKHLGVPALVVGAAGRQVAVVPETAVEPEPSGGV